MFLLYRLATRPKSTFQKVFQLAPPFEQRRRHRISLKQSWPKVDVIDWCIWGSPKWLAIESRAVLPAKTSWRWVAKPPPLPHPLQIKCVDLRTNLSLIKFRDSSQVFKTRLLQSEQIYLTFNEKSRCALAVEIKQRIEIFSPNWSSTCIADWFEIDDFFSHLASLYCWSQP